MSEAIELEDLVLTEVLDGSADRGAELRRAAVRAIRGGTRIRVIPQTSALFGAALDLYAVRMDKAWTLTDCASMEIMRRERLGEVLTADHHFGQAGFTTLLEPTG